LRVVILVLLLDSLRELVATKSKQALELFLFALPFLQF
jgi:hypothetical protein